MKHILVSLRLKIFMIALLGLIYPLAMTGLSQLIFPRQASGDFLSRSGQVVGSRLLAQKFERSEYFWPRPSAIDYNPLPSGGSNLGQASADLKKAVEERRLKLKAAHPDQPGEPPQDLLFASASGLDPHISEEAAHYQVSRVARARALSVGQVQSLLEQAHEDRQLGFLGEPRVNVLTLNLALDQSQGIDRAPVLLPTATPAATPTPAAVSPSESATPSAVVEPE